MITTTNAARSMVLIAIAGNLLAGCASATTVPTQTQPAPSATLANTPTLAETPTEVPPSSTASPSPLPTDTATLLPTATLIPTDTPVPPTLTPTGSPTPTATRQPDLAAVGLKVWTYPEDKTRYTGNEGFGLAIYYKNTGKLAWKPGYKLKLVKHVGVGEVTVQPEMDLPVSVPSGGKVEFDLWAFGSEHYGQHTWYFQLFTDTGIAIPGSQVSFAFASI
ncbi:MAG TPA: hypothetical protein VMS73_08865 [Anaerolineaceae bacterium]|nr:hypothetical protein [Anaerolineaceae bacterium]